MICIYLLLYVQISKDAKNALKDIEKTEVRTPLIVLPFSFVAPDKQFSFSKKQN
jgi:hypothetical protein